MTTIEGQPYNQPTATPSTKVAVGGIAGSLTILFVFVLGTFNIALPPEVASSITVIITFLASYFVKERPQI